jgi:hypothetical protein
MHESVTIEAVQQIPVVRDPGVRQGDGEEYRAIYIATAVLSLN